jgi:hypothetical protein
MVCWDQLVVFCCWHDIINLGSEMNTLYVQNLAEMDAYLGEGAWDEIGNFGPALENAKFEGKLRGLPIFTAPRYVFCRTDLMEASGWTIGNPQNFAQWKEFATAATTIDSATNSLTQQALVPVDAGSMADWHCWCTTPRRRTLKADGTPASIPQAPRTHSSCSTCKATCDAVNAVVHFHRSGFCHRCDDASARITAPMSRSLVTAPA